MKNNSVHRHLASWCAQHPDQLPVGLMAVDAAGCILEATPRAAQLCGMAGEDLTGKALGDTPLPFGAEALREAQGDETHHALHGTRKDGSVACRCTCRSTGARGPGEAATIIILEEIPNAAAADSARIQLEKLASIENVVAGVAHELNNPLTAMLGYAELLLHKAEDETTRRRLGAIIDESHRCSRIVQNLLTFAERNRRNKECTDVNRLLTDTLALCRYQMQVDHIQVDLELTAQPTLVLADTNELQRVLLNLMGNAHHALTGVDAENRQLKVSTTVGTNGLCIAIADTGVGVPRDIQHRIFDPFFTTRPLGEGMGLGLSVAFGIVQDHGGRIWLDTDQRGGGATFRVELPLAP